MALARTSFISALGLSLQHASGLDVERREDGARALSSRRAFLSQPLEGAAGPIEFYDLGVQRLNPARSERPSTAAILARIQLQKLADFLKSEARRLRLLDEAQFSEIFGAVAPDPALAGWGLEQTFPLVEADRLDAHASATRKLADC